MKKRKDATMSEASLKKKGITLQQVQNIFDGYLKKNYIKEIPLNEWGQGWYLPFFCVINLAKK